MATFVLRVWLPDRPGALGAVASRIGAVRGDVIGIDILERGAGRAIDELTVEIPDAALVPLLVREVGQVDGVDVEDVRPASGVERDPRLDALESAIVLVEAGDVDVLVAQLAAQAVRDFEADWGVTLEHRTGVVLAAVGPAPAPSWLHSFVAGARMSLGNPNGAGSPEDVLWATLEAAELTVILGREGRPFRARERRQAAALARIADARYRALTELGRARPARADRALGSSLG